MKSFTNGNDQLTSAEMQLAMEIFSRAITAVQNVEKGNPFHVTPKTELTKQEVDALTSEIKDAFEQEKVTASRQSQDAFIKKTIDGINRAINYCTLENMENKSDIPKSTITEETLAELGYVKGTPEYRKLNDRLIQLPTIKSTLIYLIDKGVELGIELDKRKREKEEVQNKEIEVLWVSLSNRSGNSLFSPRQTSNIPSISKDDITPENGFEPSTP